MTNKKIKTPSVLAFERKLLNSDAIMHAGKWEDRVSNVTWEPIKIQEKDVRGTISNRLKRAISDDPAKLDAEIQKANLQRVDIAALPFDKDTLKVSFTLRILGNLSIPSACNNPEYQEALANKVDSYIQNDTFHELSLRYAENLANGRFLWRNRIGAEALEIRIHAQKQNKSFVFNGYEFSLRSFTSEPNDDLKNLAEIIRNGLGGNTYEFLKIDAFVKLGEAQEIFPSQELVLYPSEMKMQQGASECRVYKREAHTQATSNDAASSFPMGIDNGRDNNKSKYLYQVNNIASMHSQKIGNALRTIDTWYPLGHEFGPIAIEPYGSVTNRGIAYRQPGDKMDFYTLLDNWIVRDQSIFTEQRHYLIAMLIRGGVFGKSSEK